jgi:hypothetical protein
MDQLRPGRDEVEDEQSNHYPRLALPGAFQRSVKRNVRFNEQAQQIMFRAAG